MTISNGRGANLDQCSYLGPAMSAQIPVCRNKYLCQHSIKNTSLMFSKQVKLHAWMWWFCPKLLQTTSTYNRGEGGNHTVLYSQAPIAGKPAPLKNYFLLHDTNSLSVLPSCQHVLNQISKITKKTHHFFLSQNHSFSHSAHSLCLRLSLFKFLHSCCSLHP